METHSNKEKLGVLSFLTFSNSSISAAEGNI